VALRLDTGVPRRRGNIIHYDPMIAKVCTRAPTREAAIDALSDALDEIAIGGIRHNVAFLSAIMHNPRFREDGCRRPSLQKNFRTVFAPSARRCGQAPVRGGLGRGGTGAFETGQRHQWHAQRAALAGSAFAVTLDGEKFADCRRTLHQGKFFARIDGENYAAGDRLAARTADPASAREGREYAMQIVRSAAAAGFSKAACRRSLRARPQGGRTRLLSRRGGGGQVQEAALPDAGPSRLHPGWKSDRK